MGSLWEISRGAVESNDKFTNDRDVFLFDLDKTLTNVAWYTDMVLKECFKQIGGLGNFSTFLDKFRSPKMEWWKIINRLKSILWKDKWKKVFTMFKDIKNNLEFQKKLFLYDWIFKLLTKLKNNPNNIIAIVTNKEKKIALQELEYTWILGFFDKDLILTSDDVAEEKPNSDMLKLALLRMWLQFRYKINNITMIWDTQADINAAMWIKYLEISNTRKVNAILVGYSHTEESLFQQKKEIKSDAEYTNTGSVEELTKRLTQ